MLLAVTRLAGRQRQAVRDLQARVPGWVQRVRQQQQHSSTAAAGVHTRART